MAMKKFNDHDEVCEYCGNRQPCARPQCVISILADTEVVAVEQPDYVGAMGDK